MLARIASLAVTILMAVLPTGQSPMASKAERVKPALRLSVRVDRSFYRMSDSLISETQLTNVSSGAVFLNEWDLCWNFARGLVLHVIDAKGYEVRTDFLPDCVPPPPRAGDFYRFVKIDGGRFYGIVTEFPISTLVKKPGEYDLDVRFDSSISANWVSEYLPDDPISKLPLWTMERPTLEAPRIHFRVIS